MNAEFLLWVLPPAGLLLVLLLSHSLLLCVKHLRAIYYKSRLLKDVKRFRGAVENLHNNSDSSASFAYYEVVARAHAATCVDVALDVSRQVLKDKCREMLTYVDRQGFSDLSDPQQILNVLKQIQKQDVTPVDTRYVRRSRKLFEMLVDKPEARNAYCALITSSIDVARCNTDLPGFAPLSLWREDADIGGVKSLAQECLLPRQNESEAQSGDSRVGILVLFILVLVIQLLSSTPGRGRQPA